MPNEDSKYLDLYDLQLETEPSYDWRGGTMRGQEEMISTELKERGYVVDRWRDGEVDSFGPLSRCLPVTTPEGEHKIIVYG